ncbi:YtxH domain-containing protein [Bradymonas sediminis]|nr:YtxH domain-containing protein [Bradymonas sediminis]TDP62977.1 YtxH-like protein [Bradymonas sediminis]
MDWKKSMNTLNDTVSSTYESSVNNLLDRMGLEHKRSTMDMMLPALGIFGAGIALGATLGVLFAPKRGEEIRSDLRSQVGQLREKGYDSYEQLRARGNDVNVASIAQDGDMKKATSASQAE